MPSVSDGVPQRVFADVAHDDVEPRCDDRPTRSWRSPGVKKRGLTFGELLRQRPVVAHRQQRAGRATTNVDCRDAAELVSTASDTRMANGPRTGPARKKKTLPWMSALPRPELSRADAGVREHAPARQQVQR